MISLLADLDRHAAERPDETAIATPRGSYSFAELETLVGAVALRLRELGIAPRQLVALDLPAAHEWILDLALLRLATRTVSIRGTSGRGGLSPDAVFVEPGRARGLDAVEIEVDDLWMSGALVAASAPPPFVDYARPDSIFRLMLTSGTTGTARAAAYSVAAFEHRLRGLHTYWTSDRPELDFMPLSTTGGFHTAAAALHHGQAFRAVDHINEESLRFAAAEQVTVMCGSPQQIAGALRIVAERSVEMPSLEEVRIAGAAPSPTVLRLIEENLRVPVRGVYGSTEGGGVTSRMLRTGDDPADVGPVLPGLELQVVDASGTPVPPGTEGAVRYRGPGMTSGYVEGGAVVPFPGGWFVPGDLGALQPDGSLHLRGRASEVINVAGLKVDPERVDALALEFPGVRDAASFGFERASGIAELALAVVAAPGCDLRALDRLLRQQLPVGHPTIFWQVAEIPRNRMGKVERAVLTQAYGRVARS